ncbi:hypothetical protein GCM10023310_12690 [Paenibacillus vulneris]
MVTEAVTGATEATEGLMEDFTEAMEDFMEVTTVAATMAGITDMEGITERASIAHTFFQL